MPRPSAALATALAEDWEYHLSRSPTYASILGDRRWNDRWDDLSLAGLESDHQHDVAFLSSSRQLAKNKLSDADRLSVELSGRDHRERIEAHALGAQFLPLNHMRGLPEGTGQFPGVAVRRAAGEGAPLPDAGGLPRLDRPAGRFRAYVDQTIALSQEGVRRKMVWPRVVMERIPPQLDPLIAAAPTATSFYVPVHPDAGHAPRGRAEAAGPDAERLIRERVQPAYRKLRDFVVGTYLPAAPTEVGVGRWPDGERLYAFCVRLNTTTDITADQAHAARPLRGGAHPRRDGGGEGEGRASRAARRVFQQLRTDPRYFYKTGRRAAPPLPCPRQAHRPAAVPALRDAAPGPVRRGAHARRRWPPTRPPASTTRPPRTARAPAPTG